MDTPNSFLKALFTVGFIIGSYYCSIGQQVQNTLGSVTIASPTAASLGKFGDIPVSYHTGVPQIGIPIYTVQAGPLKLPISLDYHASGLKAMEPAGWVGAGWALNAGGVISRTVVGLPDEVGTNGGAQEKGHFSNYGFNSYLYETSTDPEDWQGFAGGRKDGEPDLFFFNFSGYSGKFYFRDDRTPILVPQQDLKIIPIFSGGRSIDNFTIVTPDGTQYLFGNSPGVAGAIPIENTNSYTMKNGAVSNPPTSSWYLNKVISVDNQFSINLSYQHEAYGYFTISMFPIDPAGDGLDGTTGYELVKNTYSGVRLSQISFPNGTINFLPGSIRTDLSDSLASMIDNANASAVSLGGIQITDSSGSCKTFTCYTSYFPGNSAPLPTSLTAGFTITRDVTRLRLDSVREVACDGSAQTPPYKFSYYPNASAPLPRRLTLGIDHWGYFNGQTGNTGLIPTIYVGGTPIAGAVRDAAWPAMLDGTLMQMDYPTGGHTAFDFESNTGLASVTTSSPQNLATFPFHWFGQGGTSGSQTFVSNGRDITFTYQTTCNYGGLLSVVNSAGQAVYSVIFNNTTGDSITPVTSSYTISGSFFPTGTYTVTAALNNPAGAHISGGILITLSQYVDNVVTHNVTLGGIRIKTITHADGVTNNDKVTNFSYTDPAGNSTARLYSQATYVQQLRNDLIRDVGFWTTTGFQPNPLNPYGCPANGEYYKSPGSIRPMATVQGSIIGYGRVTVFQPGNGKSIYTYFTANGFPLTQPNVIAIDTVVATGCDPSTPNYPAAPLPFDSKRGELASEQHYDSAGQLLKDIYYYPTYDENPTLSTPAFIVKGRTYGSTYSMLGTKYSLNTVRKVMMKAVERDYDPQGGNITKISTTYYGSAFHNQPTRTVTNMSTGDSLISNTKYAMDFRIAACDTISDCSASYATNCNSCQTTYNSARVACSGNSSCLTTAYLNYIRCLTNARISYVSCRNTNYMGATNAFSTCRTNNLTAANSLLKPVLRLQDEFYNAPVEVTEWRNMNLRNASFTQFDTSSSPVGFVYPGNVQLIKLQSPSSAFAAAAVSGNSLSKDSRYAIEQSFVFTKGKPRQVVGRDGVPTCYIWEYSNTQPVAKAINATVDQVAYTSFESDGNGSWTVTSPIRDAVNAVTGSKSYNLTNGACSRTGLTSSRVYIVSYWSKTGSNYTVTGSTSFVKGNNSNGWVYYEHTVTNTTSVSVSGNGGIDELRLYPKGAQMSTYTYRPIIGMTSQCDVTSKIIYYEYDGLQRLLRIRDMDGNIVKQYEYRYQTSTGCGSNCFILQMTTLAGTNTLSYPVGVFNVNGKLLGNAISQSQYVALWNADTADANRGTLAAGGDSLHFNFTLNPGKTMPVITGCRYYQVDLTYNKLDGVRNWNGAYVDWGDGTGMRLAANLSDPLPSLPPNTTQSQTPQPQFDRWAWYFVHTYPDSTTQKTLTFYHNDATENTMFDNVVRPGPSLARLKNLRGNLPQHTTMFGGHNYQQATMMQTVNITNWNTIHSIYYFGLGDGDGGVTPIMNPNYEQDFMAGNSDLDSVAISSYSGNTIKLSRLKSDWSTYFTHLSYLVFSDAQWDREDLSTLKELNYFQLYPANGGQIPVNVINNVFNQIAAGAGQTVTNGALGINTGGTTRSSASDTAVAALKAKGWKLYLNGTLIP